MAAIQTQEQTATVKGEWREPIERVECGTFPAFLQVITLITQWDQPGPGQEMNLCCLKKNKKQLVMNK